MKEAIHPKYEKATITCACGEVIETRSTKGNIRVEICSKCHPFFTGKQKLVDTGQRIGAALSRTLPRRGAFLYRGGRGRYVVWA